MFKGIFFSLLMLLIPANVLAKGIIDVHAHNVEPEFVEYLKIHGASMDEGFPLPNWNVESQLEFMKKKGIDRTVLSMPAPQPMFGTPEENRRIIREYNEACASLKKQYPDRFLFCASVPLPDVDGAIEEAIYALDVLGADGIKLATNSGGQYLGAPELDRLMAVLNDRGAIVMLHPHKPVPINPETVLFTPAAVYEYPAETTRTVINMFSRNIPARFSNLKFIIPHCGSLLPLALPRLMALNPVLAGRNMMEKIDPEKNLKNMYYDLAGNPDSFSIRSLLTITTPDHLLYGSDFPYPAANFAPDREALISLFQSMPELAPHVQAILYDNAAKLFRLDEGNSQRTGKN